MKRWAVLGAVCGALATAAAQWPAAWAVAGAASRASGGRVQLADVRGSVWNGSAVLVLSGGPGSNDARALPGRVAWQARPSLHAAGDGGMAPGLRIAIAQDCCLREPLRLGVRAHAGGVEARVGALDWQVPASLLQGLGAPWNTLGFEGGLRLQAQALRWQRGQGGSRLQGQLALTAERISSRIAPRRSLGSYRLELDAQPPQRGGQPGRTTLQLRTLQGILKLAGDGEWLAGQFRFRGEARAQPGEESELANVLNLIGNRQGPITLRVLR